jgi:TAP-like protein
MWTSPTTNILDYSYASHSAIPRILGDFAEQCVQAAQNNTKYCPLAQASLNATDPAADVLLRMNNVIGNLTLKSYRDPKSNGTVSMMSMSTTIRSGLMRTRNFPSLAQYFLDAETLIRNNQPTNNVNEASQIDPAPSDPGSDTNITTAGWNSKDPLFGANNAFVFPAVTCLDMGMEDINTTSSFVNYISQQSKQDALVAYEGVSFALCLSWPNLSSYDIERITSPFPASLNNKVLVIGVTDDPVTPYTSAQATYNMMGQDNANFLVHEGFGHCSIADPNNCTTNALINFFVNGMFLPLTTNNRHDPTKRDHMHYG